MKAHLKNSLAAFLLLGAVLLGTTNLAAQVGDTPIPKKLPATYAYSGLEKICLQLSDRGTFDLFTSTCFKDESHVGSYQLSGDTITLNSTVKPKMTVDSAIYKPNPDGQYSLNISSNEPLLIRSVFVTVNGKRHPLNPSGQIPPQDKAFDRILIEQSGFPPLVHVMPELPASKVYLRIDFKDLYTPYLENERWLIDGKKLQYLPAPNSDKREDIYITRGKKCFYR